LAQLYFGSIDRSGVRIQYYRTGGEKPPVILLHGLTDNALSWNRIPLALEAAYDVVMVDARGHGLSGLDERGAGLDVQSDDLAAIIETLQLIKPVLIGHSMGGALAALTAARMPKVIRAALLIDPPWRDADEIPAEKSKDTYNEAVRDRFWLTKQTGLEQLMANGKAEFPLWDESEFPQWAKAKQQFDLDVLNTLKIRAFPWYEIAPRLQCPGLLITGDPALGAVITPSLAQKFGKLWRKGKIIFVPGAVHNILRDQYDLVMPLLQNFLRSLGRWSG